MLGENRKVEEVEGTLVVSRLVAEERDTMARQRGKVQVCRLNQPEPSPEQQLPFLFPSLLRRLLLLHLPFSCRKGISSLG